MSFLKKALFHGSDKFFKTLKPTGVNMGTRFSKPEWAIYFWDNFELAKKWAIYQCVRRNTDVKVLYNIPTGGFIVEQSDFKSLSEASLGKTCFVYEATVSYLDIGIGSSPAIQEYTVNKEVKPTRIWDIVITKKDLEDVVAVFSKDEIESYKKRIAAGEYNKNRGFLLSLLLDQDRDFIRHKYHKKMRDGTLSPGDNLENVSLEALPPSAKW